MNKKNIVLFGLVKNDFENQFAGSLFGGFWAFFQPLVTIIVYWIAFEYGFRSGAVGEIPFVLWFLAAIVPWLFFSEALIKSSNCFLEYSYLVKKVVFNIDILPIVKILASLVMHMVFLIIILGIYFLMGVIPSLKLLQIVYYLFCLLFLIYSISLITASCMCFFRDLNQIISMLLLIGMWSTPIAWNIESMPSKLSAVLRHNPLFYIVEGYRDCFIGRAWFWEKAHESIEFWIITLVIYTIGTILYKSLKPHFADVL